MLRLSSALRIRQRNESGSAIIAAIIAIGILAFIAGTVLLTAVPAYRSTYHAAAWHEARLSADAGVDLAIATLQRSLPDTNAYTWPGWTLKNGDPVPPNSSEIRTMTVSSDLLFNTGDGSTRPAIVRVEVDVLTRDGNVSKNPWYRIRSTGSADIASSLLGLDKRDVFLRRISLQRNQVTRTVEVVARPVYLWEYALKTSGQMILGGGQDWKIDSYDSRYSTLTETHRGSTGGMYDLTKSGAFGNIASNLQRPASSPYGVLIDAEGAMVRGEVQTHGGDNPDTVIHENVEQPDRMDQTRITSEFDEILIPAEDPRAQATTDAEKAKVLRVVAPWTAGPDVTNPTGVLPSSLSTSPTAGTTVGNPVRILLAPQGNQTQGGFSVAPPPTGETRFVEIYVDGKLNLNGSTIVIPPNVYAKVFIKGDVDFKNQDINYSSASSRIPGNLQMFGISTSSAARVDSSGNGHIVGVFYGPQYAGGLDGNTEIIGGFVLKTYNIAGGGGSGGDSVGAGFHYDEALGVVGPIQAYRVLSYFEDTRKDLE